MKETVADILAAVGPLADPANRLRAVEAVAALEARRRVQVKRIARAHGWPLREDLPGGQIRELIDVQDERPVYRVTHNLNAAISIAVTPLQNRPSPLQAAGVAVGMWDAGTPRLSHAEFSGRAFNLDGSGVINHATHVGATAIGVGANPAARGMAVAATLDAYDWNNAPAEILSRAATSPGEPGMLRLSNHSYGILSGWARQSGSSPAFRWFGSGSTQNALEPRFGRYDSFARDADAIAFNAPYYLQVWSAGNDRNENPAAGQLVGLSPNTSTFVAYDPAVHPPGDGVYRGGFDTISGDAVGKNVLTVGAVDDAVNDSQRSLSAATMSVFSSWGPTDDGRIKPDLVTNGVTVFSASSSGDNLYAILSGTSMSAPGATGAAALLLAYYEGKFPGESIRASTLKGLLVHTADDLGTPGPDYRFGWGLLNAEAAADLIDAHHRAPGIGRIREATITTGETTQTFQFVWDGLSPIRVTLAWTDPPGVLTSIGDSRASRLINDLDLEVHDPLGGIHQPWVMPFVGTWTVDSAALPATTGRNSTDNVEQVFVGAPQVPGVYQIVVSYTGSLTNNEQTYSLFVSGAADTPPPPPPLLLSGVSPTEGVVGQVVVLNIAGSGFSMDTSFALVREGFEEIPGESLGAFGPDWRVRFDLGQAGAGEWSIVARRGSEEEVLLADSFRVFEAIWAESFDEAVNGWTVQPEIGSNAWLLTESFVHSPPTAYTAPGISSRSVVNLVSPLIAIPPEATDLQLRFWNRYALASTRHGGRLEIQVNEGPWRDIEDPAAHTAVLNNGYTGTIRTSFWSQLENPFAGQRAWTGNSGGFVEAVIGLMAEGSFAGSAIRLRWRMSTDFGTTSSGWWIDTIALVGNLGEEVAPPVITGVGAVTSETSPEGLPLISAGSVTLFAQADSPVGEENLTYLWTVDESPDAQVLFSENETNAAKSTEATFSAAGEYILTLRVSDPAGRSASAVLPLAVGQTVAGLGVDPAAASLPVFTSLTFSARLLDQFGAPIVHLDDADVEWSIADGGTVDAGGVFSATLAGGPYALMASFGDLSANSEVTVTPLPAIVLLHDLEQVADGEPRQVNVTTEPAGLPVLVTYDGNLEPPALPGEYLVEASVTDPNFNGMGMAMFIILPPPPRIEVDSLEEWLALFFGPAPPDGIDLSADANSSGWANLADLVFGNNPAIREADRFVPKLEEDDGFLVLSYPLDERSAGLVDAQLEWSFDLVTWSTETMDLPGFIRIVETGAYRNADLTPQPPKSRVDRITLRFQHTHPIFLRLSFNP
ncbi:MAG: S8 family serine peptidase [Opitutales bacterium]|nr:S8 family serine peptidase [Opitutales bacterium]